MRSGPQSCGLEECVLLSRSLLQLHLASVLKTMALDGRGIAWLPKTLIGDDLVGGRLVAVGDESWSATVDIRLYRQHTNMHPAAEKFWRAIVAPQADTA